MKQLIFFLLVVCSISTYGQHTDTILWRESYRLKWDDFKGPPQEGPGEGKALGVSFVNFLLTQSNSQLQVSLGPSSFRVELDREN